MLLRTLQPLLTSETPGNNQMDGQEKADNNDSLTISSQRVTFFRVIVPLIVENCELIDKSTHTCESSVHAPDENNADGCVHQGEQY